MAAKDRKNSEGYSDPTAYAAMRNIAREEDQFRKLRKVILSICDVAGFEIRGGRSFLLTRRPERFGGEKNVDRNECGKKSGNHEQSGRVLQSDT